MAARREKDGAGAGGCAGGPAGLVAPSLGAFFAFFLPTDSFLCRNINFKLNLIIVIIDL